MLKFDYNYNEFVSEAELRAAVEKNEPILEACQKGHEEYRDSLGWLDTEEWAGEKWLNHAKEVAAKVRKIADTFVIIGIGGSNNSARAVIEALDLDNGMKIVYAGNTLSPYSLNKVLKEIEGRDVVIDCIAKNFETLEPGSSFRFLRQWLVEKYGLEGSKERIYCCGTIGSQFDLLSQKHGWNFFPFPDPIGGRFTALCPVHMVPLAVAGIDMDAYVKGAHDMMVELRSKKGFENDALVYASIRNILFDKGKRVEILSAFEPRLRNFFYWWEQLFGESEGKDQKGIMPRSAEYSEQLHSLGQFFQDGSRCHFETFLDVKEQQSSLIVRNDGIDDGFGYIDDKDFHDINKAAFEATYRAHSEVMPTMKITIDRIDEYHFGQLFYFFQFMCYVSGKILGINPFDQPGVEAYKKWMFEILGK